MLLRLVQRPRLVRRRLVQRLAMTAVFVGNGTAFGAWAANIPRVREAAGLQDGALGVVLLCISLGAVVAMQVAGRYAGQIGTARACWMAGLLLMVALPAPAFVPGYPALLLSGVALGLALGLLDVCMNAHAAWMERQAGLPIMSSFHAGWSVGQLLGAALAGGVAAWGLGVGWGLGLPAVLVGACGLAGLLLPAAPYAPAEPAHLAWPDRTIVVLGVLVACSFVIEGGVADWSSVYLRTVLGASPAMASTSIAVFAGVMVLMRLVGDRLVARLGPARVVAGGGAVAGVGLLIAVLAPGVVVGVCGFALVGVGVANIVPVLFSAAGARGAAGVAMVSTAGYAAGLASPPLIGLVSDGVGLRVGLGVLLIVACGLWSLGSRFDDYITSKRNFRRQPPAKTIDHQQSLS